MAVVWAIMHNPSLHSLFEFDPRASLAFDQSSSKTETSHARTRCHYLMKIKPPLYHKSHRAFAGFAKFWLCNIALQLGGAEPDLRPRGLNSQPYWTC